VIRAPHRRAHLSWPAPLEGGQAPVAGKPVCLEAEPGVELQRLAISAGAERGGRLRITGVRRCFQQGSKPLAQSGAIGDPWR